MYESMCIDKAYEQLPGVEASRVEPKQKGHPVSKWLPQKPPLALVLYLFQQPKRAKWNLIRQHSSKEENKPIKGLS